MIKELYNENNQPFVKFILELKFLDTFNYFIGEINRENFKLDLLEKIYDEKKIKEFLNNFEKIGKFLSKIKNKQENLNESDENIQDYIGRISLLCLNYKSWFENKYSRSQNKAKKDTN